MARRVDTVDALLAGLVVMWGTAFVALKELAATLDPYQLTWYRYVPFLVLYGAWLPLARRARFRRVSGRDWGFFALAGALGVIGYHFPLNWGITDSAAGPGINAATAAILVATTPLWTVALAAGLGRERLSRATAAGSLVAFSGVAVIVLLAPAEAQGLDATRKAAVVLLAPFCWGLYSLVAKPLVARYGGLFTTGLTFCLGTLMLLPLGLRYGTAPLAALDGAQWAWLLFLTLGATVAGYTIWNHALKTRSATQTTATIYFVPVVATLAGFLLLGERITAWFVLGAALVLVGVVQVNRARAVPEPVADATPPTR